MPVFFHSENLPYNLKGKIKYRKWISDIIDLHNKKVGDVNVIFTSREYLHELNKEYLQREYDTDVITFNYNEENSISGDIFIGIEQVKWNSEQLKVEFVNELSRVIIHGVLHLLGYNDETEAQKRQMRKKEDEALALFNAMK